MYRRIRKTEHKSRQAFTLVELIVVLVILAVLAAILVPTLTGYIDRAKQKKDINEAQAGLVAAQSALVEVIVVISLSRSRIYNSIPKRIRVDLISIKSRKISLGS